MQPVKSSNEILSELFGAFNAKPPEITEPIVVEKTGDNTGSDSDGKKNVNKDKKKSKDGKHHKSKKRKRSSSRLSEKDHESGSSSRKKRKKKDEKHKRKSKHHKKKTGHNKRKENVSNDSSSSVSEKSASLEVIDLCDDEETITSTATKSLISSEPAPETLTNTVVDLSDIEFPKDKPLKTDEPVISKADDPKSEFVGNVANPISSAQCELKDTPEANNSAPESSKDENSKTNLKVEDVFVEGEKPKPVLGGRIMIKNLKFSSVFEETVKQVEEQARLKAERYEEGELSDSSSQTRSESKSLSPEPSPEHNSLDVVGVVNVEKSKSPEKSSHCKHSSSKKDRKKRSRSSDKHKSKHKLSRSNSSPHKSHKDKKLSRHRSRSRSRSHLKEKDSHSSKSKTKRRRSNDRSDSYHHRHQHHHSSRSDSDAHHNHRSTESRPSDSKHSRKRSSSPARKKSYRSRSRSRSRSKVTSPRRKERRPSQEKIDKHKLLEIARKNALNMLKQVPQVVGNEPAKAMIAAGGKTVDELTDFCKLLSKKDAEGHESISTNTTDSDESESEKPFHHPFQIKDRPSSIVLNIKKDEKSLLCNQCNKSRSSIRVICPDHCNLMISKLDQGKLIFQNAVSMPLKTLQEKTAEQSKVLRLQFPVSSGQLHRKKESDWVPVSPKKGQDPPPPVVAALPAIEDISLPSLPPPPLPPPLPPDPFPSANLEPERRNAISDQVFPIHHQIDITSVMSQRVSAMRKLRANPMDIDARNQMNRAQLKMQAWAESKHEPGQFTGSTGARILTPFELAPGTQAWTRPDQLQAASPVKSGMGMTLLQKMGWRPGEGLGKNKEGALEPLLLKVKMDKKGLVAEEETDVPKMKKMNQTPPLRMTSKSLEGKHPVSLLNEYCTRRRHGAPTFDLCFEGGPDHKKTFLFKVTVNGVEYKPSVSSLNKKQARVEAAIVCLKALGVLEP